MVHSLISVFFLLFGPSAEERKRQRQLLVLKTLHKLHKNGSYPCSPLEILDELRGIGNRMRPKELLEILAAAIADDLIEKRGTNNLYYALSGKGRDYLNLLKR